jgi:hypothetical protein
MNAGLSLKVKFERMKAPAQDLENRAWKTGTQKIRRKSRFRRIVVVGLFCGLRPSSPP